MNKPIFSYLKLFFVSVLISVLTACSTKTDFNKKIGQPSDYRKGIHYHLITPQVTPQTGDHRIEVVEMFFYACPHCNTLEPKIQNWLKGKEDIVNFIRIPAILGPTWAEQAKAYYVAEKLGIIDKIHPALLKAIHENKRQFYNEYSVLEFFVEQGVNRQDFIDIYNSSEITEKVNHARIMTVKYALRGVPAIIINGKFKTAQFYTGSQEKMLEVVDLLIADEKSLGVQ